MPLPYLVLSGADLALTAFARGRAKRLRRLTKPALMPALALWVRASCGDDPRMSRMSRRTVAALGLSTAGDVALLRDDDTWFLAGLGSFLGAHVAYGVAFGEHRRPLRSPGTAKRLGPVAAVWAVLVPGLAARAGSLRWPVAAYGTVLAAMQGSTLVLADDITAEARTRLTAGAACFLVSDSLIGARRFLLAGRGERTHRTLDVAVMATYTTAQWLIADGVVRATRAAARVTQPQRA